MHRFSTTPKRYVDPLLDWCDDDERSTGTSVSTRSETSSCSSGNSNADDDAEGSFTEEENLLIPLALSVGSTDSPHCNRRLRQLSSLYEELVAEYQQLVNSDHTSRMQALAARHSARESLAVSKWGDVLDASVLEGFRRTHKQELEVARTACAREASALERALRRTMQHQISQSCRDDALSGPSLLSRVTDSSNVTSAPDTHLYLLDDVGLFASEGGNLSAGNRYLSSSSAVVEVRPSADDAYAVRTVVVGNTLMPPPTPAGQDGREDEVLARARRRLGHMLPAVPIDVSPLGCLARCLSVTPNNSAARSARADAGLPTVGAAHLRRLSSPHRAMLLLIGASAEVDRLLALVAPCPELFLPSSEADQNGLSSRSFSALNDSGLTGPLRVLDTTRLCGAATVLWWPLEASARVSGDAHEEEVRRAVGVATRIAVRLACVWEASMLSAALLPPAVDSTEKISDSLVTAQPINANTATPSKWQRLSLAVVENLVAAISETTANVAATGGVAAAAPSTSDRLFSVLTRGTAAGGGGGGATTLREPRPIGVRDRDSHALARAWRRASEELLSAGQPHLTCRVPFVTRVFLPFPASCFESRIAPKAAVPTVAAVPGTTVKPQSNHSVTRTAVASAASEATVPQRQPSKPAVRSIFAPMGLYSVQIASRDASAARGASNLRASTARPANSQRFTTTSPSLASTIPSKNNGEIPNALEIALTTCCTTPAVLL